MEEIQNIPNENIVINEENKKPMVILFCIMGDSFSSNFLRSWTELFGFCISNNIQPIMINNDGKYPYENRNKCLGINYANTGNNQIPFQGKVNYDYIMWIDSKTVFNVDMFKSLLSSNKNIVSGLCLNHDLKTFNCIESFNNEEFLKTGVYNFIKNTDISEKKENNEGYEKLLKVNYSCMNFMLMKKGIIEQFDTPWFQPLKSVFHNNEGEQILNLLENEEYYFSKKCNKLNIDIFVNIDCIVNKEFNIII